MSETATITAREIVVPETHRVLIAAAVAAVVGPGARILGIEPVFATEPTAWTRSGRAAIQSSHNWSQVPSAIRSLARRGPGAMK